MRVFAPNAFRYPAMIGVDYPYGWQELPLALADTLKAAGYVKESDDQFSSKTIQLSSSPQSFAASLNGSPAVGLVTNGELTTSDGANGGGQFPSVTTNYANNPLMANQIHPGTRGQVLESRQLAPVIMSAINAISSTRF